MTVSASTKRKINVLSFIPNLICLSIAIFMLFMGKELKEGVIYGIELSLQTIVPTLFPFFVLSDLWSRYLSIRENGPISNAFERLFGINGSTASAFLCGAVCGLPLGAKSAVDYYNKGLIDKDELQRLCAISSNPSAAFVISGIGAGIYGDSFLGLMLYMCLIFSIALVGIISAKRETKDKKAKEISRQSFDLVNSIKNAGLSSVAVSSYIIFFSALIGLWQSLCKNKLLNLIFSCLAEVSSACCVIRDFSPVATPFSFSITAFALGFSGFSVHLQAFSFMPKNISKITYLLLKISIGITSAIVTFLLFSLIM